MRKLVRHTILLLMALFTAGTGLVRGQVIINDVNFRHCLTEHYPGIMKGVPPVGDSLELDTASARTKQGPLNCSNRTIKDVSGLQYFENIWSIDISYNQISDIPSLANYTNFLKSFNASHNQLKSFPTFSPGATALTLIDISENLIDSFPASAGNVAGIDSFLCFNNYLSHQDLLYFKNLASPDTFKYAPQHPTMSVYEYDEGDTHVFHYKETDTLTSYTAQVNQVNGKYSWGLFPGARTYTVSSINHSYAGTYEWKVANTYLKDLKQVMHIDIIKVRNKNPEVFTPNGDGIADEIRVELEGSIKVYNKTGELVKEFSGPANWDGTDSHGKLLPLGTYILRSANGEEAVITLIY